MKISALIVGLLLVMLPPLVRADHDRFSWHGFVAQGLTSSTASDYITTGDKITTDLTEVGLNATYVISPSLSVAGQVMYLNGGNRFRQGTRLDYLFLDWRVTQLFDWQVNVHLGRYKNRHWLYSATQDVPQTRPSILLPQSVYFDSNRDVALSSDGIALQSTKAGSNGTWEVRWSYGRSPLFEEDTKRLISPQAQGLAKQDYTHQFSTYWQPDSMRWQIGFSLLKSEFTYHPAPEDFLINGFSLSERVTLAARYDSEAWELTTEYLRDRLRYTGSFAQGFPLTVDNTSEGGYVQWRYFLQQNLTGLVRFDTYDVNRDDRNGELLVENPFGAIPSYYGYMDTLTVGLSWDIQDNLRLSGEFARVRGAGRLSAVFLPDGLVKADPYWNAWAIQLMYWF
ncbi:hypothetical protein [Alteromonas lipolytica]|uniref:Alginate export domain-containing protein n=1 Tax=Alteromonas lipolytica TaxID=1856405 RepID=A0A1E8FHJ7_9ALTE|nr:hypothetical protein [Alteromonas lipolytica]OFI35410.1 hypothetical protein BFC17_11610 [Alteromonas lipolytica]GGF76068.1 hypothetical protein GCM10011338_30240 [Alteromonas lipolytica]